MIRFTILGEPASKANSRVLSTIGPKDARRTILRKGNKALAFERDALRQIPPWARQRLEGPVAVTLRIWYASERPDLDESIVLDVLQDRWSKRVLPHPGLVESEGRALVQAGVYRNDRQVREKHVYHAIDRKNPRVDVEVEPLQAQQSVLTPEFGAAFAASVQEVFEARARGDVAQTDPFADLDHVKRAAA